MNFQMDFLFAKYHNTSEKQAISLADYLKGQWIGIVYLSEAI